MLVRLAPVEERSLQLECAGEHADGHHTKGDVRRVLPVVGQGGECLILRRGSMRESHRPLAGSPTGATYSERASQLDSARS